MRLWNDDRTSVRGKMEKVTVSQLQSVTLLNVNLPLTETDCHTHIPYG